LSAIAVFEADYNHAVAAETFSPSVDAVFLGKTTGDVEFVVACHTDVVVADVAFQAVIARVNGRDGEVAHVAEGGEVERAEGEVGDGSGVGGAAEGC
jgi:hypothetical protein